MPSPRHDLLVEGWSVLSRSFAWVQGVLGWHLRGGICKMSSSWAEMLRLGCLARHGCSLREVFRERHQCQCQCQHQHQHHGKFQVLTAVVCAEERA